MHLAPLAVAPINTGGHTHNGWECWLLFCITPIRNSFSIYSAIFLIVRWRFLNHGFHGKRAELERHAGTYAKGALDRTETTVGHSYVDCTASDVAPWAQSSCRICCCGLWWRTYDDVVRVKTVFGDGKTGFTYSGCCSVFFPIQNGDCETMTKSCRSWALWLWTYVYVFGEDHRLKRAYSYSNAKTSETERFP